MTFRDFEEFIASLNRERVRYLIVGGYAVAFHARPRATKDIDVLVDRSVANARRVRAALQSFLGAKRLGIDLAKLFISLADLVASKVAAGRPQDMADVDVLRRAAARKRPP